MRDDRYFYCRITNAFTHYCRIANPTGRACGGLEERVGDLTETACCTLELFIILL